MTGPALIPARVSDIVPPHPAGAPALVEDGRVCTDGELRREIEGRAGQLRGLEVGRLSPVMRGTLHAGTCLHLMPRFSAEALLGHIRGGVFTIVQGARHVCAPAGARGESGSGGRA